jgi:LysM repeat protein
MTKGTKVFLAVFAALIGILVLYYGVFVPGEPTPAVSAVTRDLPRNAPDQPQPGTPVYEPQIRSDQSPSATPGISPLPGFLTHGVQQSLGHEQGPLFSPASDAFLFAPEVQSDLGFAAEPEPYSPPLANQPVALPVVNDPVRPVPSLSTSTSTSTSTPRTAQPAPSTPRTPPVQTVEYTVKAGDTMTSIAEAWFGDRTRWSLIARENPLDDPNRLRIGQKLRLPPKDAVAAPAPPKPASPQTNDSTLYTVRSGDTLAKIAREVYGDVARWEAIYQANRATIGSDPGQLKPGMQLKLPPKR